MPEVKTRIVLVDTNCFLRLYASPVLPLLGQIVGGYKLLTLTSLIEEFHANPELIAKYSRVTEKPKADDLANAVVKLRQQNVIRVANQQKDLTAFARSFLQNFCKKHATAVSRSLSNRDLELLATTIVLRGVMATDEWPLRLVAEDLMQDAAEYDIGLFNSLDILHLLERNGKLSAHDRKMTVDFWVRDGQKLPRDWQQDYLRLFNESADALGQ